MTIIEPTVFDDLVTAPTGAITTIVSNITTARPITVNAKMHYSAINPYNTRSMNMDTKEGKYQYYIITNPKPGWSIIVVNMENAEKLLKLFKDRTVQFGLDSIMKILTAVTGVVKTMA